jgi:hypothetical protein
MWEKKSKNGMPTGTYKFSGTFKGGKNFVENVIHFFDSDASNDLKNTTKMQNIILNDTFYDCFFQAGFYDCIELLEPDNIVIHFEQTSDNEFIIDVETANFRHPLLLKIINSMGV